MAADTPEATGWQADGSYVPCPDCRWEPPPDSGAPGVAIHVLGLPAGWVTDPALDLGRTAQLRLLGNTVVPHVAALAWQILTERLAIGAAA